MKGAARQAKAAPVPQGDDPVGEAAGGGRVLGACQPKVRDLQLALVVEQQVGGLEVAVQDVLAVAEIQPLEQLLHVTLDLQQSMQYQQTLM